jgi:hypothetical protein
MTRAKLTLILKNRMAIGDLLQSVFVWGIVSNVSRLGSYISSYFESSTPQPAQYKSNREWNNPINNNAKGTFCVYYQNVHGVPHNDVTLLAQDLQLLAVFKTGCMCFSQTNLDWNQLHVKYDYLSRHKTWKHAATSLSSIDMESMSDYITGGTLTSTVNKWSSCVFKKESNPSGMGHWSSQTLVGKNNSKMMIITGYRCVQNSSGDSSTWSQEISS